jgi:hypothetical protein
MLTVTERGETWFLGDSPIMINFFTMQYVPQIGLIPGRATKPDSAEVRDEGFVGVGAEWVENEALQLLGLQPKGEVDGRYMFDVNLTNVSRIVQ